MATAAGGAPLDYYLVLDFEATCDDLNPPMPQEIIEFPVLKVNSKTFATEDTFHKYVRPTVHPQLTRFCTELTGITQDKVEGQPTLKEVLEQFNAWMEKNGLLDGKVSFTFVTCGDWDLKTMLPGQCKHFRLPVREYFRSWINIKKVFKSATGVKASGMPSMLKHFDLQLLGRHHSGIDDSKNIVRILAKIAEIYPNLKPTTTPK